MGMIGRWLDRRKLRRIAARRERIIVVVREAHRERNTGRLNYLLCYMPGVQTVEVISGGWRLTRVAATLSSGHTFLARGLGEEPYRDAIRQVARHWLKRWPTRTEALTDA